MSAPVDFKTIRAHAGSQNNGFEELCCQLASLDAPTDDAGFFRKSGAGGDAGVECFFQLSSGEEHCWQAKYFFQLGAPQWSQIDKSVRVALDRHPKMTRYTICLPIDLTDRRSKRAKSQRNKFDDHVQKWLGWCPGREISFELWGAFELTKMLSRDNPLWSGRRLYWFDDQLLSSDWFRSRFEEARSNLGDRYTPELNVDLPIAQVFEGVSVTKQFWKRVSTYASELQSALNSVDRAAGSISTDIMDLTNGVIRQLKSRAREGGLNVNGQLLKHELLELQNAIESGISGLKESGEGETSTKKASDDQNVRQRHYGLLSEAKKVSSFLDTHEAQAAESGNILLVGEAGTGKSHLLGDVADRWTGGGLPAVLLLAHSFPIGDPWQHIRGILNAANSADALLGALDAAGQAAGVRCLLLIDALNEGQGRNIWPNQLAGLATRIARFPWVALVVSCRSTYERRIISKDAKEKFVRLEHFGFLGHEEAAARTYLDSRGIARPSAPTLLPEFSNPLFLKTLCDSILQSNENAIPKGLRGITKIFDYYVDSLETIINARMGLDEHQKCVRQAVNKLVEEIVTTGKGLIEKPRAIAILDQIVPSGGLEDKSLLAALIDQGALSEDVIYQSEADRQGIDMVRFTFERFSDHFIADHLLGQYFDPDNPEAAFAADAPLGARLAGHAFENAGLLEALAVQIPERCGVELPALLPSDQQDRWTVINAFRESLLWREPKATNDETIRWLNHYHEGIGDPELLATLIRLATEPGHGLNARSLHKNLERCELAERDAFWSTWIAESWDWNEEGGRALNTLVDWAWHGNTEDADAERIELASITLAWMLSTSHREARDRATKALVAILGTRTNILRKLLLRFDRINDPYILERLYAVAYGVAMLLKDTSELRQLARTVFNRVFLREYPIPHVLLRDYARGILERANSCGVLPDGANMECARPPYRSDWPLIDPGVEEVDALRDEISTIYYSVMSDDFGTYIMNCVFDWSETQLSIDEPRSWGEVRSEFLQGIASRGKPEREAVTALGDATEEYNEIFDRRFPSEEDLEDKIERQREILTEMDGAFEKHLGVAELESWRWLRGSFRSKDKAVFSRRFAKRWIVNRVKELGWTEKRFQRFQPDYRGFGDRHDHRVERIGKKYQWIALHELIALMSDNLYFFGHSYGEDIETFQGPWQFYDRDIDPSFLANTSQVSSEDENRNDAWWAPSLPQFDPADGDQQCRDWVKRFDDLPEPSKLLNPKQIKTPQKWIVLSGSYSSREEGRGDGSYRSPWRNMYISVSSIIVKKSDLRTIFKTLDTRSFYKIMESNREGCSGAYLGEYSWHPSWENALSGWESPLDDSLRAGDVHFHDPIRQYFWEKSGSYDFSIDSGVSIDLPSPMLVERLGLEQRKGASSAFFDQKGRKLFFNPAAEEPGPASTLIDRDALIQLCAQDDLAVLWGIAMTKRFHEEDRERFTGELFDSSLLSLEGEIIRGRRWTNFETIGPVRNCVRKSFVIADIQV